MITKTRALVLHSFKYGEQQMIVDFLTETCGNVVHYKDSDIGKGQAQEAILPAAVHSRHRHRHKTERQTAAAEGRTHSGALHVDTV